MNLYNVLSNRYVGMSNFERLFAQKFGGTGEKIKELEGVPPLTFTANGQPLLDYRIYGNTEQTGTPTPENPIIPSGCGERTENLFDESTVVLGKYINAQGVETNSSAPTPPEALNHTDYIKIQPNTNYTYHYKYGFSVSNTIALCWFDASKSIISRNMETVNYGNKEYTLTGTSPANAVFCIINFTGYLPNANVELSFNSGSIALPYEPYGYKLPILSNSTVTNIYLGEVQSTRRINKLVLDGTESWQIATEVDINIFYIPNSQIPNNRILCTHYAVRSWGETKAYDNSINVSYTYAPQSINVHMETYSTVSDFKSYLAAQYANGTPVTIWYVLEEPETGIVNEPLMKIGDYADTVSMEQAGVSIPTNKGSTTLDVETTIKPSNVYIKYKS